MTIEGPKKEPATLEGCETPQFRKLVFILVPPSALVGGLIGKYFEGPVDGSLVVGGAAGMVLAGIIAAVRTRIHFKGKMPKEDTGLYFSRTSSVLGLACGILFGVLAGIIAEGFGYTGGFRYGVPIGIVVGAIIAAKLTNRKYGKNNREL